MKEVSHAKRNYITRGRPTYDQYRGREGIQGLAEDVVAASERGRTALLGAEWRDEAAHDVEADSHRLAAWEDLNMDKREIIEALATSVLGAVCFLLACFVMLI